MTVEVNKIAQIALTFWNRQGARLQLIAARENHVYRVTGPQGDMALRLHRVGLRSQDELISELSWMAAMVDAGLTLPCPIAQINGSYFAQVEGVFIDALTWVEAIPMGHHGVTNPLIDARKAYHDLGIAMAKLHIACDAWQPPAYFTRPAWNAQGLLGDAPLWHRFWENPTLTDSEKDKLLAFRNQALDDLNRYDFDYGLIHADLVPDNVLIQNGVVMIDFDDGGFGYRLFDLATVLNRTDRLGEDPAQKQIFLAAYLSQRPLDMIHLPLFSALRAVSYIGWFIPRLDIGSELGRNRHYIDFGLKKLRAYMGN